MRPATAGELANPNLKIAHWDVVSSPERGDTAAYALSGGTAYSGHSTEMRHIRGFKRADCSRNGDAHNDVKSDPDDKFNSTQNRSVVYRRTMEIKRQI